MNEITKRTIDTYKNYLIEEEKSSVTIEKYIRDITAFINWTEDKEFTKTLVLEYKSMLTQQYAPASVNSVLSSLNGYFCRKSYANCLKNISRKSISLRAVYS